MIDKETAAFIQTGVSISTAACGIDRLPSVSRGLGCRVAADGSEVRVFVSLSRAAELLSNVRGTGRVANVFSLPSSNRTVQLKGSDARVEAFDIADVAIIEEHIALFLEQVVPLGTSEAGARAILAYAPDDLATVVYTPSAAFSQTPGPKAGKPLGEAT
ncbi:MAG: hypothetical protein K9L88_11725 [Chromatiaceae bacterium]|nr:hypothetical protein [Chromatiaceae bacterium]